MRGTSAEAEQRPAQSERLSQLSESLPEWRIRRSGGGAERFVAPFVTLRRSRTQDAARVEQLRGHTADYLFKNYRRGSAIQTFSRGSVSAEMAIRSAGTGNRSGQGMLFAVFATGGMGYLTVDDRATGLTRKSKFDSPSDQPAPPNWIPPQESRNPQQAAVMSAITAVFWFQRTEQTNKKLPDFLRRFKVDSISP